jgi:hypothetical protein
MLGFAGFTSFLSSPYGLCIPSGDEPKNTIHLKNNQAALQWCCICYHTRRGDYLGHCVSPPLNRPGFRNVCLSCSYPCLKFINGNKRLSTDYLLFSFRTLRWGRGRDCPGGAKPGSRWCTNGISWCSHDWLR